MVSSLECSKPECRGPTKLNPTAAADRKQRKRIQNRLNQRAHRLRNGAEKGVDKKTKSTFRVQRWRVDEYDALQSKKNIVHHRNNSSDSSENSDSPPDLESNLELVLSPSTVTKSSHHYPETIFPLPADHLLNLIYYNTFRGLYSNKIILQGLAISLAPGREPAQAFADDGIFPEFSILLPSAPIFPDSLALTTSQMSLVHSSWIDPLPFPKMRENLIRWEASFNHAEFIQDLIGDLMNHHWFPSHVTPEQPEVSVNGKVLEVDDEITATRKGLIIWGEPYQPDSWEATPGFLEKWAWAVEGCDGLIESSNRWRMIRGEEPIQLSICS